MKNKKSILFLFNLSMDLDNPILATTNLWANQFAKHFDFVHIYSTHVGRYEVPKNVFVTELGGGNFRSRIHALIELFRVIPKILKLRNNSLVFHHQSPRTSVFPGLVLRLVGINQGIWYSHSSKPFSLLIGSRIANKMFSSSPESLPLSSKKAFFFGHGVDTERAERASKQTHMQRSGILFVGRISPIKNLEECIIALADGKIPKENFLAIGPFGESNHYLNQLKEISLAKNVKFLHENQVPHEEVFARMAKSNMFYAGMKNSVDKSCLEAAATGCFVITTDYASAKLSGMTEFWSEIYGFRTLPDLATQISVITQEDLKTIEKFRSEVQMRAVALNSVSSLIEKITAALRAA